MLALAATYTPTQQQLNELEGSTALPVPGVTSDDTQYVDSGSGPEEQEGKKGKVITDDDVTSEQSHTGKKSACSL